MMDRNGCSKIRLSVCALGVAFGMAEAVFMMLFAWSGWLWGYGTSLIQQISTIYYGYAPTFQGGLWGGLWGLIDGFIFGVISAWVYNLCLCFCVREKKVSDE